MSFAALSFDRHTSIADIVALCPQAEPVLAEYGLHCVGCAGSSYETLEQGCLGHGFGDDEIEALVEDLNDVLKEMPARPETITVTLPAAKAIGGVAKDEGREGEGLVVTVDGSGGFCMEFRRDPEEGERVFFHPEEPSVRLFASALTLRRIGGATIDFRDDRFKLDLPEDALMPSACGCKDGGECGCE